MKKGKVKRAKLFTWCYLVLVLIASYFMYKYFDKLPNTGGIYIFVDLAFTFICSLMLFYFGCFFIWFNITTYKIKLNAKRFAYHYNRCITAFENMDYEKVYDTYIKRFKNDQDHKYLTEKLIFAYNIIRNNK
jgi:hypothetical protein